MTSFKDFSKSEVLTIQAALAVAQDLLTNGQLDEGLDIIESTESFLGSLAHELRIEKHKRAEQLTLIK